MKPAVPCYLCFYYVVTKDKLICDLKSQFSTIIPIVKVRLRSKVSSSKFYGPGPGLFIKQYFVDIHLKEAFIKNLLQCYN